MARDRVSVHVGRTISLGNYESVRLDFGLESDVKQDENVKQAFERVRHVAESHLEEAARPIEEALSGKEKRRKS